MAEREDYFDYVVNVLGIKSVFVTSDEKRPLLLEIENYSSYTAEEIDLLEKMILALKIELEHIRVHELGKAVADYDFKLQFVDAPAVLKGENQLQVFSPRMLLKNAALKKQAWNDLQKVIKFFAMPRP